MALTQVQGGMLAGSTNTTTTIQSNGTTAITIDSSQNVGIGTTSPNKGSVSRAVTLNGTAGNIVEFCVSDTRVGWVYGDNNLTALSAGGSRYIAFETNGSERMRITSGGDLCIKTTTAGGVGTTIYGQYANQGLIVINSSATTADVMYFQYNGSIVGKIATTTTATSFVTSSDYRLKENITPMTGALDKVARLKPVTYTWKENGSAGQGFIAHELAEVVPDAVSGEKDAVDEKGNIKPQGIDTSFLVATLTAAIQELKAELDATKAEVAALKAAP